MCEFVTVGADRVERVSLVLGERLHLDQPVHGRLESVLAEGQHLPFIVLRVDQPVLVEALDEEAFDLIDDGGLDELVAGEEGASAHERGRDVFGLDLVLEPFGVGVIKQLLRPSIRAAGCVVGRSLGRSRR